MKPAGLTINLGLKSVRAIVFDGSGRKMASSSRPVGTLLRDSWIEQDPAEWWDKTVAVIQEVVDVVGPSVGFLTVTASAACLVPVDSAGAALRRAIMVSDRRSTEQALAVRQAIAFDAVRQINSAFAADPYFQIPKMLWLAQQEQSIYERTKWMMTPADYLLYKLTGHAVTDALNAEKFYYDVTARTYPTSLLNELELDAEKLPPVVPVGERIGAITSATAEATGLRAGTPAVMSTYDAICAFWGSGVSEFGDVADVSGTVTSVRVLSDCPIASGEHRVFAQAMPGTDMYVLGGSNNLGGGLIEWLKQSFYAADTNAYDAIQAEALTSGPAARGLLFLPYLLGERCPVWDSNARGVFFGLERQHQRGDFARAVCDSTAFGVEHVLRTLRQQGAQTKRLRVSGGLARLTLVNAIKADVCGLPTEVLDEFETTAVGAFLIAGSGMGLFSSLRDAAEIVRVREIILPNPQRREQYLSWFELYLKLYDALKDLFAERHGLFVAQGLGGVGRLENL